MRPAIRNRTLSCIEWHDASLISPHPNTSQSPSRRCPQPNIQLKPRTQAIRAPVPSGPPKIRLSGTGLPPGRIKLAINGFNQQTMVTVPEIVKGLQRLPAFHLVKLAAILYDPDGKKRNSMKWHSVSFGIRPNPTGTRSLGSYRRSSRLIFIMRMRDRADFFETLFHEIGHHVYYQILRGDPRFEWANERSPRERFVSAYAATNASEDFAESYAAYVTRPDRLKNVAPAKYAFMQDVVFGEMNPRIHHLTGIGSGLLMPDAARKQPKAEPPLTYTPPNVTAPTIPGLGERLDCYG